MRSSTTGKVECTAPRADLALGSSSVLRAHTVVYAQDDNKQEVMYDYVTVLTKVMN